MKHFQIIAFSCALLLGLSSCSLLPKEEELPSAPVIQDYEGDDFTTCTVERGSVISTESLSCSYLAVRSETLRFELGGEVIEHVYVQTGSVVKAGDVLAELTMGTLKDDLENQKDSLEVLKLQLDQAEESRQVAINAQNRYRATLSSSELKNAQTTAEVSRNYDSQIERISDQITVAEERIEELETKVKERQIIAGIDGAVTSVAAYEPGDLSSKTMDFIMISDNTTSAFVGGSREKDLFEPGEEVTLTSKTTEYAATVASAEDFGIEDEGAVNGYYNYYFALDNPDYELEEGDKATIEVILEEKDDVLWLPDEAIHYKGETPIVYYENDDGIRDIKEIEIGLSADHRVEVVSGLDEGDTVILS